MKKKFLILAGVVLAVMVCLGASCSKKEQPAKKEVPANHQKMVEEMNRRTEEAKKVVVATVNGNKITLNELIREMNLLGPRFVRPGEKPTPKISAEVRKTAMDNLVFRELALQEAARQGMEVTPAAVDKALQGLKKRLGSEAAYKVYLARMGAADSDMKKIIREDNLFRMITAKEIFDKVKQPDISQLKEAYRKERLMLPERFIVDDVFFRGGNTPDMKKEAEGVLSDIKAHHGDLSKLATGGFVVKEKTITQSEFPDLYNDLEKLKPGGISGIIESGDGLHILKLKRKEPARRMTFEEARNIITQHLKYQAIQKRKDAWEGWLKKKAKIEITMKGEEGIKPAY